MWIKYQPEIKTFISSGWWRSGPLCFTNVVRTSGVCVCVCGRGGKWIRLVRCGARCDSDADKGRVQKWWDRRGLWWCDRAMIVLKLLSWLPTFVGYFFIHFSFFFTGSARRKLTCTICNRKCSSSLNLQEHRKVRLYIVDCTAQNTPTRYSRVGSDRINSAYSVLHDPLLQWCLFLAVQWDPSHSPCNPD